MTFTFGADLDDDVDFVRFETGDTNEEQAWLSDELITSMVAKSGTLQGAVISGLKYIIMQLSKPDFKADWISVTNGEARKGYQQMLQAKADEYGISLKRSITASVVNTYRSDSYMEDPN